MTEVPLSYSAEELLGLLESAVHGSAPAEQWLSALSAQEPGLVDEIGPTTAAAPAPPGPLTRSQVADRASEVAAAHGAAVAKAADVAAALVQLVQAVVPIEPEPVEPEPVEPEPIEPEPVEPERVEPERVEPEPIEPEPIEPEREPAPTALTEEPLPLPSGRTRTFRVFVSSTFEDFAVERNVLRSEVWPRLRDLCRQHGARFQPIDLRWGVSEEAALDQQTMNICLGEIDRCQAVTPRPDFLVLLGNRYGWRPPPPQIPADEYDGLLAWLRAEEPDSAVLVEQWYDRDDNAVPPEHHLKRRTGRYRDRETWAGVEGRLAAALGAAAAHLDDLAESARGRYLHSATAQEIARGALEVAEPDRAVAFVREIGGADGSGGGVAGRAAYVDDDQAPLEQLKDAVRRHLGPRVITAPPVPLGDDGPVLGAAYLEQFARGVHDALASSIREELEHPLATGPGEAPADALDEEIRAHRRFAEDRAAHFTGRADDLAGIGEYLDHGLPQPLVVHGEGGCGKSALMSRLVLADTPRPADCLVLARFVGATPASVDGRSLLRSLCEELARSVGDDTTAVPSAYNELVGDFTRRFAAVSADRPVWVVVDSLDQLGGGVGGARSLTWVPAVLPPGARMVLSTRSGETLEPLRSRAQLLELGGLTRDDGTVLVAAWLEAATPRRTLQDRQLAAVLDAFEASRGNPLYLRLATEEARRWESGDGEPPEHLAVGVRELIRHNLLHRLASEDNHGQQLVGTALGYLAASRDGLAEDELTDLLARDLPLYRHVLLSAYHVPEDLSECAAGHPLRPPDQGPAAWIAGLRADAATHAEGSSALDDVLASVVPAGPSRPRPGPELPVVLWSRLSFDLGPYLTERRTETGTLLGFYHRELQDVAAEEYVAGEAGGALHSRMADYFRELADPRGDGSWTGVRGPDRRGLSELPHHLTRAERWDDVTGVLTDFTFLEQKATHVGVVEQTGGALLHTGVFALEDDYDEALAAMGGGEDVGARPRLIVTAVDLGEGLAVRCPHCNTVHPCGRKCETCDVVHRLEDWQGHEVSCPNPACGGPLRVNDFVVERR
jgi:hypothetical protein